MDDPSERIGASAPLILDRRGEAMVEPDAAAAMLRLKELGWGSRRISAELGVSRTTVKAYLHAGHRQAGHWQPFAQPVRSKKLDEHTGWLRERFRFAG